RHLPHHRPPLSGAPGGGGSRGPPPPVRHGGPPGTPVPVGDGPALSPADAARPPGPADAARPPGPAGSGAHRPQYGTVGRPELQYRWVTGRPCALRTPPAHPARRTPLAHPARRTPLAHPAQRIPARRAAPDVPSAPGGRTAPRRGRVPARARGVRFAPPEVGAPPGPAGAVIRTDVRAAEGGRTSA